MREVHGRGKASIAESRGGLPSLWRRGDWQHERCDGIPTTTVIRQKSPRLSGEEHVDQLQQGSASCVPLCMCHCHFAVPLRMWLALAHSVPQSTGCLLHQHEAPAAQALEHRHAPPARGNKITGPAGMQGCPLGHIQSRRTHATGHATCIVLSCIA